MVCAGVIQRNDGPWARALFVDLGYGAEPFTTLESAARLRKLNPDLRLLGVEIDPERVATALPYADAQTYFRRGGFNLPLGVEPDGQPEVVRCIRAFNVLRQYEEAEVAGAYAAMAHGVLPGGLLVEGTSDPYGRLWVANILRRTAAGDWRPEALVFSTNFRAGFEPALFQPVLPKNYIHRMVPGEPIAAFIDGLETNRATDGGRARLGAAALVSSQRPGAGGGRLARGATEAVAGSGLSDPAPAVFWPVGTPNHRVCLRTRLPQGHRCSCHSATQTVSCSHRYPSARLSCERFLSQEARRHEGYGRVRVGARPQRSQVIGRIRCSCH